MVAAGFPFVFLAAFVAYPLWQEIGGSFSGWYQLKPHGFEGARNYVVTVQRCRGPRSGVAQRLLPDFDRTRRGRPGLGRRMDDPAGEAGQGLLTAVFLVPLVVPWTVAGTLFYGLFNIHGVADQLSQDIFGGGSSFIWFDHPRLAFGVIVAFGIWKGAPGASSSSWGAERLPGGDVRGREDRRRPGVSFWWRVVLPAIRPMLIFVVVLRFLAEAQTYDSVAMLTNGGPSFPGATELVGFYANVLAFGYYNFGEASAMGTLIGVVLVIVAVGGWMLAFPRPVGRRRLSNTAGPHATPGAASGPASRLRHWALQRVAPEAQRRHPAKSGAI